MNMKELLDFVEMTKKGTFNDGTYFKLNEVTRGLVDAYTEEIYLATSFLSISSKKLHSQSKKKLNNDLVKGDDQYPMTISAALNFLK